ncbi:4-galactosyl-N-acetylglucosaminide 3-alpha-L-fucosyltransferase FUT5-like [Bombina bombina]|uniref:4-galactosyl-N-acetylglucosaminide 3-alpha-L-fucosyltransferase FUT5-like n=1 Tax=Bombina bombina TaxID=8345 RepID=UPI00235B12D1|nr:4-galactosyl-N-acetylglucosaminide 3-alpha-L-fucosyltransferase FUT5-like [Bombina bombina]
MFYKHHLMFIILVMLLVCIISFSWRRTDLILSIISCKTTGIIQEKLTEKDASLSISTQKDEKELLILIWVWPFREHFPLDACQRLYNITGCTLTANQSLYDTADALVIHHVDIMYNSQALPQKPRPHFQRWVWFNREPPLIIKNLHFLDNLFNMTMTFRQDSDIYRHYGRIEAVRKPQNLIIPPKSKMLSWVVSNWSPGMRRNDYYEMLKKHISIDIYGQQHKKLSLGDFHKVISQYKFYLAFENSVYKDYITEKLWSNAFESWAVPIVLGTSRKNYERFIPSDAFIHVDDFSSPKELADFLLELDKDDERYRKYFNWRSHYKVRRETGWAYHYCIACRALRQAPDYQVIPSIAKWFLEDAVF